MKKILALSAALLVFATAFSAELSANTSASAAAANRRTAKRYLQLAKQHAADRLWAEADSEAQVGLAYDESVADLWYIRAVSLANLGGKRADVIPLVMKALDGRKSQWVDYNRDNARILYADQLAGTLRFKEALATLDMKPLIYSADAEFIRVQCYYSLGDGASVEKARDRVDSARKVYPDDVRFAELFYNHEFAIARRRGLTLAAQRLADSFLPMVKGYRDADDDLHLLAISFISDEAERERRLRAFAAEGRESVLYPMLALSNGILDEAGAISQFCSFADASSSRQPLRLPILQAFASALPGEESRKALAGYLNAYDGVISADTDGDLADNLVVEYRRGRPKSMSFDRNQDGVLDWTAECDFGTPLAVHLTEPHMDVEYGPWPFVRRAVYTKLPDGAELSFRLIAETLSWSPFGMGADPFLADSLGAEFFVPLIPAQNRPVSGTELLVSSSSYTMPSKERPGASVEVSLLNGVPQGAAYSAGGKVYARAQFEGGLPVLRLVDSDGDGLFETTEQYGMTGDLSKNFITEDDEIQIITNLFGAGVKGTGFYVKLIQLDRDGDTVPDFIEEYMEGLGKVSSWDTDSDGNWDVRYTRRPRKDDRKPLVEVAEFHQPGTKAVVSVTSENGVPMNVSVAYPARDGRKAETVHLKVFRGESFPGLFWLGRREDAAFEPDVVRAFSDGAQGVSRLVEVDGARFHAVLVGGRIYAEQLAAAGPEEKDGEPGSAESR